jgi:tetratricopeptide (TPR) repeat protein
MDGIAVHNGRHSQRRVFDAEMDLVGRNNNSHKDKAMRLGRPRLLAACVSLSVLAVVLIAAWFLGAFEKRDRLASGSSASQAAEVAALLVEAERAMDTKAHRTARKLIQEVLSRDPENSKALLYQAAFLEQDGDLTKALEHVSRISDLPASFGATARYMEGKIHLQQNKIRLAEERFLHSLRLNPNYVPPAQELIQLYALQLRGDDLTSTLKRLREVRPLSVQQQAMILLAGREIVEQSLAIPTLTAFLAEDPTDVQSIIALARYRVLAGDPGGALDALERHREVVRQHEESRALMAYLRVRNGKRAGKEPFPVRQPLDETSPLDAWSLAANLASRAGDWKTTAEINEYLRFRQPFSTVASHALATALDRMDRPEDAALQHKITSQLDQLELLAYRMLRPQAGNAEMAVPVMCEISDLLKNLDHSEEAVGWLNLALVLSPNHPQVLSRLSDFRQRTGEMTSRTVKRPPDTGQLALSDEGTDADAARTSSETNWMFRDVATALGVSFEYHNGQSPRKRILETIGGGSAVLDLDGDLWPDLYLPQGQYSSVSQNQRLTDRLFRNQRGTAFVDCTESAGIVELEHSLAATVADFDNDGFADVFVATAGTCRLFKNRGDGTFEDVTPSAISLRQDCSSCACFADLNDDGFVDLFVVSYVADWEKTCVNSQGQFATCDPREFEPGQSRVYQNTGDGEFRDVTASSGLDGIKGRGLGVIATDLTSDGRVDLFVANDGTPNFLFRNGSTEQDIRLDEIAAQSGVAVDENGRSQAGMGIAAADFDNNGFVDIFVTNFYREQNTLYSGLESGLFVDESRRSGLGPPSFQLLGFGTQAIDVDSDGDEDLIVMNGDIDDYSSFGRPWKMPTQVFRNNGNGQFDDVSERCGSDIRIPQLGRGLTRVDFDGDLVNDLVAVRHDGNIQFLRNETKRERPVAAINFVSRLRHAEAFGSTVSVKIGSESKTYRLMSGDGFSASNHHLLLCPINSSETHLVISLQGGLSAPNLAIRKDARIACVERLVHPPECWQLPL